MKLLICACLFLLAPLLMAQPAEKPEKPTVPFPEVRPYEPRGGGISFRYEYFVVEDEMGALENHVLASSVFTMRTPSLERWSLTKSKDHSAVFTHPLFNEVEFFMDCWPSSAWPDIKPEVFQGRINAMAEPLLKDGFTEFEVITAEEDFSAEKPTKKLRMADGREIEVLKRGHTRPFREAEQYVYELLARKLNQQGDIEQELLIYETVCIHPKGFLLRFQISGPPDRVAVIKPWLQNFLLNSREDADALKRKP